MINYNENGEYERWLAKDIEEKKFVLMKVIISFFNLIIINFIFLFYFHDFILTKIKSST